jgi:hypothetical protein
VLSMFQQSRSKLTAPRVPPQPADPSPPRRSISQSGNSSSVHNGIIIKCSLTFFDKVWLIRIDFVVLFTTPKRCLPLPWFDPPVFWFRQDSRWQSDYPNDAE